MLRGFALEQHPEKGATPSEDVLQLDRSLQLQRLRGELSRRQVAWRAEARRSACSTGLEPADRLLGGGFPKGQVSALSGALGAGASSFLAGAMALATASGECCAWVVGAEGVAAPALAERQVDLSRLLVVRADGGDAAWAAMLLARSGAFSLVGVDWPTGGLPSGAIHRLVDAARAGGTAVVLICRGPAASAFLQVRIEVGLDRWPARERMERPVRRMRLWVERSRQGGEASCELLVPLPRPTPGGWQVEPAARRYEQACRVHKHGLPWFRLSRRIHATKGRRRFGATGVP